MDDEYYGLSQSIGQGKWLNTCDFCAIDTDSECKVCNGFLMDSQDSHIINIYRN